MMPTCRRPFSAAPNARCCVPRQVPAVARAVKDDKQRQSSKQPLDLALFVALTTLSAGPAHAGVDDAVNSTVGAVQAAGSAIKSGIGAAQQAAGYASEQYQKASPKINEFINNAKPVVKRGVDEIGKVASPLAEKFRNEGLPEISNKTRELLTDSGVDVEQISRTASSAEKQLQGPVSAATPTFTKVWNFLTTADPQTLGKTALAVIAAYILTPVAVRGVFSSFRGYSGDISPARAVDLVGSESGAALIDIRSAREKEAVGVPDVPGSARGRFIELEAAQVERKLRGQLRNVDGVEAQVTALEIAALKRVSKNSSVLVMDRNGGGPAKGVAKELQRLGFRKVYIVTGGFSGWNTSKLQVRAPVGKGQRMRSPSPVGTVLSNIVGTVSTRKPSGAKPAKR